MRTFEELEVAELAASGLSNKQIGQLLFLSPRTVSNRLYHLFPKLGITTRAAPRDALNDVMQHGNTPRSGTRTHEISNAAMTSGAAVRGAQIVN